MMRRRVGRPLVRTAVVGGAAYMAGSHAANKAAAQRELDASQDAQIAQLQDQATMGQQPGYQPQYAMPPQQMGYQPQPIMPPQPDAPAAAPARDPIEQLKQLGELKAAGVLTDTEFEVKKAQLLSQI